MCEVLIRFSLFVCLFLPASTLAQSLQEDIEQAIQSELAESGIPSLQVAVSQDGKVVFASASGYADIENNVKATLETKYRSSSISKWFTATAAIQLYEQKQLDLDAPVQKYCPAFPEKDFPITTRQLLTHTSGIRHYRDYESELSAAKSERERSEIHSQHNRSSLSSYKRYTNLVEPLELFMNDALVFEPGTNWLYSSFGYRLLGCVLEGASGSDYRSLMDNIVFSSLGMGSTTPDDAWTIVPNRVSGYRLIRGKSVRRADMRDVSENLPAGGHLTTATDLVIFGQAFIEGKLVSKGSVSLMTAGLSNEIESGDSYVSWRHAIPSSGRYAYGIMAFPNEKNLWLGHTGRQAGSSSIVIAIPEQSLVLAALTNAKGWGGYLAFIREVHAILMRHTSKVG
jgi:CubicO group peptidase (beta-lactamase class C family)